MTNTRDMTALELLEAHAEALQKENERLRGQLNFANREPPHCPSCNCGASEPGADALFPKCPCGVAYLRVENGGYVPVCSCAALNSIATKHKYEGTQIATAEPGAVDPDWRTELAECRNHLSEVMVIAPFGPAVKAAADWLANWDGKRIDPTPSKSNVCTCGRQATGDHESGCTYRPDWL